MKMAIINNAIKINKGQLCKIINEENEHFGSVVKFANRTFDTYCFKTIGKKSGEIIKITNKDDFMFLPYEGSILNMIDLAIDTKDDEWIEELYNKLIDECELEPKK
jgi:hypothetical protein